MLNQSCLEKPAKPFFNRIYDLRLLTPEELGKIVADQRQHRGWSQETLAEITRLNVRTVQRVENGEPSNCCTDLLNQAA